MALIIPIVVAAVILRLVVMLAIVMVPVITRIVVMITAMSIITRFVIAMILVSDRNMERIMRITNLAEYCAGLAIGRKQYQRRKSRQF